MTPPKSLRINRDALAAIRAMARAALPNEACGLLVGVAQGDRALVHRVEPADNVAAEPAKRFEIDPRRLFQLLKALRGGPEELIGHWHSHPTGAPVPSACDREMAHDPSLLWLVLGAEDGAARAWCVAEDGFAELALEETEGAP